MMGKHKPGQVPIGAYVNVELRDYLDKLVYERGFSNRSDGLRTIIREHSAVFSKRVDGSKALTPLNVMVNDDVNL
jgi:metal-responsive CopG/Arc/MetJ family transcriptional regulator